MKIDLSNKPEIRGSVRTRLYHDHVSNSSYAILSDHHQLNRIMVKEWRIFSITDPVYNHLANDCALLRNHPEAAYI